MRRIRVLLGNIILFYNSYRSSYVALKCSVYLFAINYIVLYCITMTEYVFKIINFL
jgi:hypothetical protein